MKKVIVITVVVVTIAFVIGCLASSNPFEGNIVSNMWNAISELFVSLG